MSYNSLPRTSCAPLSAVALFITAKMQKQTKGPFTDKEIRDMWCAHVSVCVYKHTVE